MNHVENEMLNHLAIKQALSRMSGFALMLMLWIYQGYTTREIAERLQCSHQAVSKAIRKIREDLTQ